MNFGERLKQIRTERNLTQPQMSAATGIEQSYLSQLENDKSQPSADKFGAIVAGALGLALMLAANDGIFSSNHRYKYVSKGVLLKNESDAILSSSKKSRN